MKHFNCRELRICSGWSCSHSNSNINFQAMTRNISQNLSSITLTLASIKTKQLQNQPSNQPTHPYFSSPLCPCPPPKKKKGKEIGAYYKIIVSSKLMGLLHFACEMKSCSWEISCSSLSYILYLASDFPPSFRPTIFERALGSLRSSFNMLPNSLPIPNMPFSSCAILLTK